MGMIYGYALVSTDGQSVEAQVTALTDAGAEKVFREVASGAKIRLRWLACSIQLGPATPLGGDALVVLRPRVVLLGRLCRHCRERPTSPRPYAG
jgi:DNA invertase Pin-like site-specific DNA recombinase